MKYFIPLSAVERKSDAFEAFVDREDYYYDKDNNVYIRNTRYYMLDGVVKQQVALVDADLALVNNVPVTKLEDDDFVFIKECLKLAIDFENPLMAGCNTEWSSSSTGDSFNSDQTIIDLLDILGLDDVSLEVNVSKVPPSPPMPVEQYVGSGDVVWPSDMASIAMKYNEYIQKHGMIENNIVIHVEGPAHCPVFFINLNDVKFCFERKQAAINFQKAVLYYRAICVGVENDDIVLNTVTKHRFRPYKVRDVELLDVPGFDNTCAFSAFVFLYYAKKDKIPHCLMTVFKNKYDQKRYVESLGVIMNIIADELRNEGRFQGHIPVMKKNGITFEEVNKLCSAIKVPVKYCITNSDVERAVRDATEDTLIIFKHHAYLHLNLTITYQEFIDNVVMYYEVIPDVVCEEVLDETYVDMPALVAMADLVNPIVDKKIPLIEEIIPQEKVYNLTFKKWTSNYFPKGSYDLNLNFRYGKYGQKAILDKFYKARTNAPLFDKRDQKDYGHPTLRTICDAMTVEMWNEIHSLGFDVRISDIGSKIHKMNDFTNGSILDGKFDAYYAYRPKIMPGYDDAYWAKHGKKYEAYLLDKKVDAKTDDDANVVICVDAFWYEGVQDYIANKIADKATVYVLHTVYPQEDGKYEAYDGEALAIVNNDSVMYHPKRNHRYEHPQFAWPSVDSTNAVIKINDVKIAVQEISRTRVGAQLSMVLLRMTHTDAAEKAPDLEQNLSYMTIEYKNINLIKEYPHLTSSFDVHTGKQTAKILRNVYDAVETVSRSSVITAAYSTMLASSIRELEKREFHVGMDVMDMVQKCILWRIHELDQSRAHYTVASNNVFSKFNKFAKEQEKPIRERLINTAADMATRLASQYVNTTNWFGNIKQISMDEIGGGPVTTRLKDKLTSWMSKRHIKELKKNVEYLPDNQQEAYVAQVVFEQKAEIICHTTNNVLSTCIITVANLYFQVKYLTPVVLTVCGINVGMAIYKYAKVHLTQKCITVDGWNEYIRLVADMGSNHVRKYLVAQNEANMVLEAGCETDYVTHVADHRLNIKPQDLGKQARMVEFGDSKLNDKWVKGGITANDIECTCNPGKYEQTGYNLIANGERYDSHALDSCLRNGVYAICARQLQKCPLPEKRWFDSFNSYMDNNVFPELLNRSLDVDNVGTVEDYLRTRKPAKARKYEKAMQEVLETGHIVDSFNCFVKNREAKYGTFESVITNEKPRIIMGPHRTAVGWPLVFNYGLKKLLMKILPSFVVNMNAAEMSDYVSKDLQHVINGDCTVYLDGQNHDAHQNDYILKVHNKLITLFFTRICNDYDIPEGIRHELYRHLTNIDYTAYYMGKTSSYYMKIQFHATVASGMGIHTTVGNSFWIWARNVYICHQAGLKCNEVYYDYSECRYRNSEANDVFLYVTGDDSEFKLVNNDRAKLIKYIEKAVCYNNNRIRHGTGESIKEIGITKFEYSNFISLHSVRHPNGQFVYFRQLHKALLLKPRVQHLDKYEHMYSIYMAYAMWGRNVPVIQDIIHNYKAILDDIGYSPSPKRMKAIEAFLESYDVCMQKTHAHLLEPNIIIDMWDYVYGLGSGVSFDVRFGFDNMSSDVFDCLYNKIGSEFDSNLNMSYRKQPNNARSFRKRNNSGQAYLQPSLKVANVGIPKPPGMGTSKSAQKRRNRNIMMSSTAPYVRGLGNYGIKNFPLIQVPVANTKQPLSRNASNNISRNVERATRRRQGLDTIFVNENRALRKSVHDLITTHFFSNHGITRGLARGMEETALTTYRGSFDINLAGTSTTNGLTFGITPSNIEDAAWMSYSIQANTINNGVVNPYTTTNPRTAIAGPFNGTNYSNGIYRVVSFTLKLLPSAAFNTQSGEGAVCINFEPNGYSTDTIWSRSSIDNAVIMKPIENNKGLYIQWVPNSFETSLTPKATNLSSLSAIQIYYLASTQTQFRAEWTVGIEYVPATAYKPIVNREPPTGHPDSYYWIDQIVRQRWSTLVLTNYDEFRKFEDTLALDGSQGFNVNSAVYAKHTSAGDIATGTSLATKDNVPEQKNHNMMPVIDEWEQMTETADNDGSTYYEDSKNAFCKGLNNVTGYTCDELGQSVNQTANKAKRALTNAVYTAGVNYIGGKLSRSSIDSMALQG